VNSEKLRKTTLLTTIWPHFEWSYFAIKKLVWVNR